MVFEHRFSADERAALKDWVENVEGGIETLFGAVSVPRQVIIERRGGNNGPVPFGRTRKDRSWSTTVYVDTDYSWQRFRDDWTLSHELSHLLFPYLGDSGRWFSEGLASYLQYQIMYASGTLDWNQVTAKMRERISAARNSTRGSKMSIAELSYQVGQMGAYVRLYWGGAAYFLNVDQRLADEQALRLTDVIAEYLQCCFSYRRSSAAQLMRRFDEISDSKIFTEVYQETVRKQGFPDTGSALRWLEKNPLVLSDSD